MIIQMITENQSRAVNDMKIHSSIFSQTPGDIMPIFFYRTTMMSLGLSKYQKGSIFPQVEGVSFQRR